MWHPGRGRSRHHRVVSLAVALLQLATVTWIPAIHPLFHPDAQLPHESNALAEQSGEQQLRPDVETFCIICAAGHEVALAIDHKLPTTDVASGKVQPRNTEYHPSHDTDTPANPARAPPSR